MAKIIRRSHQYIGNYIIYKILQIDHTICSSSSNKSFYFFLEHLEMKLNDPNLSNSQIKVIKNDLRNAANYLANF